MHGEQPPSPTPSPSAAALEPAEAPRRGRRGWMLGIAGLGLAAGVGVAWWRQQAGAGISAEAMAALWALRADRPEGGEPLALQSLRGKPLLINFWATWCAPCVRELPEFERFYQAHRARGVQVLGLAIDAPTPVRAFLQRVPLSFPIGLAGLDGTDLVQQLGNPQGALPFSVLFDAQGRLAQRRLGETRYDELVSWLDRV